GSASISNATAAGATLNATITAFSYAVAVGTTTPEQITASGTGTLDFGSGRKLTLAITSLVITGGVLKTLSGSASVNASVGGATLTATISAFSYAAAVGTTSPEQISASGTGTLTFGAGRT